MKFQNLLNHVNIMKTKGLSIHFPNLQ